MALSEKFSVIINTFKVGGVISGAESESNGKERRRSNAINLGCLEGTQTPKQSRLDHLYLKCC
jgi:hypothetical protein